MTALQQPPPQQQDAAADTAAAAAIASVLLTAVSVDVAVHAASQVRQLAVIPRPAVFAVLQVVMSMPPGQTGAYGAATITTERLNLLRRAQFVLSAARRIGADLTTARSQGRSVSSQLGASVQRERRFYAQNLLATWQRSKAGAQADSAAMTYGDLLGWHAVRAARTSKECLAADGNNFYASHMPLIGYPGAVHPYCRCQPGPPFPGARLVPSFGIPAQGRHRRAA